MTRILFFLCFFVCFALTAEAQQYACVKRNDNLGLTFGTNGYNSCVAVTDTGAALTREFASSSGMAKAEDAAHGTGETGTNVLSVRDDDLSSDTSADGDYAAIKTDSVGRLYVNPYGGDVNRFLVSCSSAATGTADTAIVSAVVGNRIYVTSLTCNNTSGVASILTLKDGSTAKWAYYVGANTTANNVFHVVFPTPIRGTANTALQFAMTTTSTSTSCCATYFTSGL